MVAALDAPRRAAGHVIFRNSRKREQDKRERVSRGACVNDVVGVGGGGRAKKGVYYRMSP